VSRRQAKSHAQPDRVPPQRGLARLRLPAVGPFDAGFWRSPLRGPWLASILSAALLPLVAVCALTGFVSHWAYDTDLGANSVWGGAAAGNGFDLYGLDWPTSPVWLYAVTQGVHVVSGVAAVPILLAKLWTVIPKLFENPPVLSPAHALERLSLVLLVGGSLFVFATGVINIQLWYPFGFSFVPAHYYGAIVMLAALALHVALKLRVMRAAFRHSGVTRPLREDLDHTRAEPGLPGVVTSAPHSPAAPTLTRRAMLAGVGAASAGLAVMTTGQVAGGPLADLALLAPRGRGRGDGPNDFPVNKTFAAVNIPREKLGPDWRLLLHTPDERRAELSREELLALDQVTAELPIACVEGWSTTQTWTGVRLRDLARLAGVEDASQVEARSMQPRGVLRAATLNRGQLTHPDAMLALRVNGADLSLDHGYPARIMVPALPGVHCTKWVGKLVFS
jgi:DMSO/TMAO reductase YedYZ molybdopterin-dependent catalytic subunit